MSATACLCRAESTAILDPSRTRGTLFSVRRTLTQQTVSLADLVVLRPRLSSDEALLGVGSTDVWSYAGFVRAPRLILVDARSCVWFENLVLIGLFHIVGTPEDFSSRLFSRTGARGQPFDERLLRDTFHHITRAVAEHLGRSVSPRERAGIFEVLVRHAAEDLRPEPVNAANDAMTHFLLDQPAFNWLSGLVRNSHVLVLREAPFENPCINTISNWLEQTTARLALCFFIDHDAIMHKPEVDHELPNTETTRVITSESDGRLTFSTLSEWTPAKALRASLSGRNEVPESSKKLFVDEDWDAWCERILTTDAALRDAEVDALAQALGES